MKLSAYSPFRSKRQPAPGIEEFAALLERQPSAAFVVDAGQGYIFSANAAATELTAYTRQEMKKLRWSELVIQTDESDTPKLRKRDGSYFPVQVDEGPLGQAGWRLALVRPLSAVRREITNSRQNELFTQSLRAFATSLEQPSLDKAVQQILQATTLLSGAQFACLYLIAPGSGENNQEPVFERQYVFGAPDSFPPTIPLPDMIRLQRATLWQPGKPAITSLHINARAKGWTFMASSPLSGPQGLIGLVLIAGVQINPSPNLVNRMQSLGFFLTHIVQFHRRLEQSKQEQVAIFAGQAVHEAIEASETDGLLVLDPALRIVRLNPAAEIILGYPQNEAVGQPAANLVIGSGNLPSALQSALQAAQRGVPTHKFDNVHLYRRYGEPFLAQLRVLPVSHNKSLNAIVLRIRDLSEQEQIAEQTEQLEHHAMLGEVTAVFAHEVRNPINNISTGLQLMAMNLPAGDPNIPVVERLMQDCDRLAELMKSVLAFSRAHQFQTQPVDLEMLLNGLLSRLGQRLKKANVEYTLQVHPDCPHIMGNQRALEQVFNNLITNAMQAMAPEGGRLAVKVAPQGGVFDKQTVEVSVADTGPGIPPDLRERVFLPFFTTHEDGTGLGLAISKRIITAHRGAIRLESVPGGTVFAVQLPAILPAAEEQQPGS